MRIIKIISLFLMFLILIFVSYTLTINFRNKYLKKESFNISFYEIKVTDSSISFKIKNKYNLNLNYDVYLLDKKIRMGIIKNNYLEINDLQSNTEYNFIIFGADDSASKTIKTTSNF